MAKQGLKIALPNKGVDDGSTDLAYSSEDTTLRARLNSNPLHFGVFDYTFASNPAKPVGVGANLFYDLAVIPHDLGYVPACLGYILVLNQSTDAKSVLPGSYYGVPLFVGAGNNQNQYISCAADSQNLHIRYSIQNHDDFPASVTYVDMTGFNFEMKYYIFVNEGA